MKKLFVGTLVSMLFLAACGDEEQGEAKDNQEASDQEEAEQPEEGDENGEENSEPSPEEVLEEAAAFYDDLDGLYFVTESEMRMETDGENENIPEGESTTETREVQWQFMLDDEYYNRLELEMTTEGEEEGEEFSEEQPATYQFTDIENSDYTITYDEGDTEAIRYEAGSDAEGMDDLSAGAYQYEQLLENAKLTYLGEEEVNGYQTYHIEADQDGEITEYWFDQDTYYEIKQETAQAEADEFEPAPTENDIEIIEYEVNPEFDESLFEAPEDIEVEDGEIADTID